MKSLSVKAILKALRDVDPTLRTVGKEDRFLLSFSFCLGPAGWTEALLLQSYEKASSQTHLEQYCPKGLWTCGPGRVMKFTITQSGILNHGVTNK